MASDQATPPQPSALVASDRVEGTAVYGANNRRIGRIERLMIDKVSGKVAYAVMTFGGFFGLGEDHYPLPWPMLHYDTKLDGYKVEVNEQQLKDAPKFRKDDYFDWSGRHEQVHKHYGVDPIWY
jgi:PRC-barrel domain